MSTKIVTLAYPYTDVDGTDHDGDDTVELPTGEANELLAAGRARRAGEAAPKQPAKKRAARKRATKKAVAPAKGAADTTTTDPVDPPKEN